MKKILNDYAILLWTVAIFGSIAICMTHYVIGERGIPASGDMLLIDTNEIEAGNQIKGPLPDSYYKIDVNTATLEELTAIPGVGEVIAKNIILEREKGKKFENLEDLTLVKGIGPNTVEKMKEFAYCG